MRAGWLGYERFILNYSASTGRGARGACNPPLAHKALSAEDKIGAMLPCNVIVQEGRPGEVEVAAINPMAAMDRVGNTSLTPIAREVTDRLERVVQAV